MTDIDASWNGEGSLDDHRMKVMETLEQPGFGQIAKQVPTQVTEPILQDDVSGDDDDGE